MPTLVATGQFTLNDLFDGISIVLSNNAHLVPASSDGSNPNLTGCASTASVRLGSSDITSQWTIAATPLAGVTGSLVGTTYTVTGMTVDTGYVDFVASKPGQPSLTARFSLAKVKQGVATDGNQDFSEGFVGWSWNPDRTITAITYSPTWITYQPSYQGRPHVMQQTTGQYAYLYSNKLFPVQAGRTYRIRSSVWIGAVAPTQTYVGMRALDSAGAATTGNGGHIYNVVGGTQLATNQWHNLVSASFTPTGIAATFVNVQLLAFLNYGVTVGADSAIDGIWLEDITESTAAAGSATAAAASATTAGTSATNSGNSATAAATSATNAGTSYTNTRDRAASLFPPAIAADMFTAGFTGNPTSVANITVTTDAGFGPVWQAVPSGSVIGTRGVVQALAGRIYEVRAVLHWSNVPAGQTPTGVIGIRSLDAAYATIGGSEPLNGSTGWSNGTNGAVVTLFMRFGSTAPLNGRAWNTPASAIWLRPYITLNGSATSQVRVRSLSVTDVTDVVSTETQASAAALSASQANTSSGTAGSSASASSSSAVNAAASFTATNLLAAMQLPDRYDGSSGQFFTHIVSGAPSLVTDRPSNTTEAGYGPVRDITATAGSDDWGTRGVVPAIPGRIYKIEAEFQRTAKTGTPNSGSVLSINTRFLNSSYTDATPASAATSVVLNDAVQVGSFMVSDVASGAIVAWPTGTAWIRPYLRQAYGSLTAQTVRCRRLTVTDVTEQQAALNSANAASTSFSSAQTQAGLAGGHATAALGHATTASGHSTTASGHAGTASTQASNASSSAAAAATSAAISAAVGLASLNRNPMFTDWVNQTGENPPAGWEEYTPANGTLSRVIGLNGSPNAVRTVSSGTGNYGISVASPFILGGSPGGEYVVIEADFTLVAGNMTGSGVYSEGRTAASGISAASINFATTADASGVVRGAGVVGSTYRYRLLCDLRGLNVDRYIVYGMNRWSTFSPVGAATLDWHRLSIRAATQGEIASGVTLPLLQASVTTTQTTVANLSTQNALARFEVAADTGGGTARLRLVSSTYGTNVLLDADKIFFGDNTVFDNNADVLVTTNGSIQRITALGATFGADGTLTEWEGDASVTWGNFTRANAYYYRANAAPYAGGSRRLVRTELVETEAITKEYRSDDANANNYNTVGAMTARTTIHYIAIPTTGKKISFNAQFLLQAHHSQDNYTLYVVVERTLNSVVTDVFTSNIKCLTTNGDGYVHGWQMINFTDTPAASGSVDYSIRVYHTYSIGGPGNFVNYIVSHKSISIREHRTE